MDTPKDSPLIDQPRRGHIPTTIVLHERWPQAQSGPVSFRSLALYQPQDILLFQQLLALGQKVPYFKTTPTSKVYFAYELDLAGRVTPIVTLMDGVLVNPHGSGEWYMAASPTLKSWLHSLFEHLPADLVHPDALVREIDRRRTCQESLFDWKPPGWPPHPLTPTPTAGEDTTDELTP